MFLFTNKSIVNVARGKIFIISAPSGAGKSTLCKIACNNIPDLVYSISSTTRDPRIGEVDGIDYFFVSKKKFINGIYKGFWLEWAMVHENFYGTSASFLHQYVDSGHNVILDIDVWGARQVVNQYSDAITIFVMTSDIHVLEKRLKDRGTENEKNIKRRLHGAIGEIKHKSEYRYIIINDDLNEAVHNFIEILKVEIIL